MRFGPELSPSTPEAAVVIASSGEAMTSHRLAGGT